MVKFSKQFEGQLVPEWKEKFMDYWQLKKDLKKMQLELGHEDGLMKEPAVQGHLAQRVFMHPLRNLPFFSSNRPKEHRVIQVHTKLTSSDSKGDLYETELLDQFLDTEAAREFFARLDMQLNKVNQFYKGKEKDFVERSEDLKKQMSILLELKTAFKQQQGKESGSSRGAISKENPSVSCSVTSDVEDESSKCIIDIEKIQGSLGIERCDSQDHSSSSRRMDDYGMLVANSSSRRMDDYGAQVTKSNGISEEGGLLRSLSGRVVVNSTRKNLKINIPPTTPSRTISALTDLLWDDLVSQSRKCGAPDTGSNRDGGSYKVNINKTKLHHAEKMIRGAFIELYKGLGYMKIYRNLNMLAFAKILKKFDKVTGKQVLPIYLKVVESSYFNSSDKVVKLADEVEELFIKNFADDDKKKAMMYLKPTQRKDSHAITFFIGLFTGCFIALFTGYCIMAHISKSYTKQSGYVYMQTVYPVLSTFSLLFLHLFLYGCNIFMWRKMRINYSFIFELTPTRELKYQDIFLICTGSMTAVMGAMFMHLALSVQGHASTCVQGIPGILLLVFSLLLICPFNILYKPSRIHFLKIMRNIVFSPLYKVVMLDFFMADQLCSQVPMLRSLEYVACYYISGSFRTQDYGYCMNTSHFRDLAYAISFLPYYWRAMQCARRWFDEGDTGHLINLGKYVSAMLAAGTKVAYENDSGSPWLLSLVIIMSSAATMYQLYWDFVKDWGLLQVNSKNPWLRNDLILKSKFIYYLSMVLNLFLRLAWLQTVIHPNLGSLDSRFTSFLLAALEVIRRGQWNFYRLENEHLNNAGKFRAVKTIPLPFHEVDED